VTSFNLRDAIQQRYSSNTPGNPEQRSGIFGGQDNETWPALPSGTEKDMESRSTFPSSTSYNKYKTAFEMPGLFSSADARKANMGEDWKFNFQSIQQKNFASMQRYTTPDDAIAAMLAPYLDLSTHHSSAKSGAKSETPPSYSTLRSLPAARPPNGQVDSALEAENNNPRSADDLVLAMMTDFA